jgi:anti-sigma factor RsiW
MNCREFRNKHVAFVDDFLPAVEMESMRRHVQACPQCSRHDTSIRRSLMLVRSLPPIEPSPDFMARLEVRLQEVGRPRTDEVASKPALPSLATFTALAAGIAAIGYIAVDTTRYFSPSEPLRLAPVVATMPETVPTTLASPAFVASVPTGMAVWPAVLSVTGQAPLHFASMEFREAR